jgi:hypothetical protein
MEEALGGEEQNGIGADALIQQEVEARNCCSCLSRTGRP